MGGVSEDDGKHSSVYQFSIVFIVTYNPLLLTGVSFLLAGVREDTSMAALQKLKPAFQKGGTTTAGNSSQVSLY